MPPMSVRHRIQASPGVPSAQSLWLETVQVSEMQLRMCQQVDAQFAHEIPYKRLSIQVRQEV